MNKSSDRFILIGADRQRAPSAVIAVNDRRDAMASYDALRDAGGRAEVFACPVQATGQCVRTLRDSRAARQQLRDTGTVHVDGVSIQLHKIR
jgi:hypothetical protein